MSTIWRLACSLQSAAAMRPPKLRFVHRASCFAALALVGCVEGPDPNSCTSTDCQGGLVCGADEHCADADTLHDVTIRWTLDGTYPTAASPGRCSDVGGFDIGVNDGRGAGLAYQPPCVDGAMTIARLPRSFANLTVAAYRQPLDQMAIGQARATIPDETSPLVDVELPLSP